MRNLEIQLSALKVRQEYFSSTSHLPYKVWHNSLFNPFRLSVMKLVNLVKASMYLKELQ
jgi:hypothetical protein